MRVQVLLPHAMLAPLLLFPSCKRPAPACFKIQSTQSIEKRFDTTDKLGLFEVFVMAHPPDEPHDLLDAVWRTCGKPPEPRGMASHVQWWIFKETRDTPRTLVPGSEKHNDIGLHRDDQILELSVSRYCARTDDGSRWIFEQSSWSFERDDDTLAYHSQEVPLRAADGSAGCAK